MNALERAKQRLKDAANPANIKAEMAVVLRDNLGEFADAVVEQLEQGKNGDGKKISPKYANPIYAATKAHMNPKPGYGTPDLKLSGDFHDEITARMTSGGVKIHGANWKTPVLMKNYGASILQVSAEKLAEIRETVLLPYLRDRVKKRAI